MTQPISFNSGGMPRFTYSRNDCLQMVDPYYPMAVEFHMLIILVPLIAFNLIPSLKLLAPFSAVANVLTFVGLGIVVYYLLTNKKSTAPLDLWGSMATFPLFFGTILFALTAVGVVSFPDRASALYWQLVSKSLDFVFKILHSNPPIMSIIKRILFVILTRYHV